MTADAAGEAVKAARAARAARAAAAGGVKLIAARSARGIGLLRRAWLAAVPHSKGEPR